MINVVVLTFSRVVPVIRRRRTTTGMAMTAQAGCDEADIRCQLQGEIGKAGDRVQGQLGAFCLNGYIGLTGKPSFSLVGDPDLFESNPG